MLTTEQRILIARVNCGTNSLKRVKEAFETDFLNTRVPVETIIIRLVNKFFATSSVANVPDQRRLQQLRGTDTTDILSSTSKENDNFSIRSLLYM